MYLTTEILREYVKGVLPSVSFPPSQLVLMLPPELWIIVLQFCELREYGILAGSSDYFCSVALDPLTLLNYCGETPTTERPKCKKDFCYCSIETPPGMYAIKRSHIAVRYICSRTSDNFSIDRDVSGRFHVLKENQVKNGPAHKLLNLPFIGTLVLYGEYLNGVEKGQWISLRETAAGCPRLCARVSLRYSVPHGPWSFVYGNGTKAEGNFVEGKLHGEVTTLDTKGRYKVKTYNHGVLSGPYYYHHKILGFTVIGQHKEEYRHGAWRYTQNNGKKSYHKYIIPVPQRNLRLNDTISTPCASSCSTM